MGQTPRHLPHRRRWGPSLVYLAVAAGLVGGMAVAWWPSPEPAPSDVAVVPAASPPIAPDPAGTAASSAAPANAPAPAPGAGPSRAPALPAIARLRDPGGDQTPDLSDYVNPGEKPTMNEVIDRLHRAGVHTGLGAFSPPGTRPPLRGLAVPEDFALPPGYVRHYQATDDGQRIEPILMFAPDYQPRGADGLPVALPADRVVPPELAPPGLPIRRIVVPPPAPGP
jgi:hypothetical protein